MQTTNQPTSESGTDETLKTTAEIYKTGQQNIDSLYGNYSKFKIQWKTHVTNNKVGKCKFKGCTEIDYRN
jgi:hypothetical protein